VVEWTPELCQRIWNGVRGDWTDENVGRALHQAGLAVGLGGASDERVEELERLLKMERSAKLAAEEHGTAAYEAVAKQCAALRPVAASTHELALLKEARELWNDPSDASHVAVFYRMLKARGVFTDEQLDDAPDPVYPPTDRERADAAERELSALRALGAKLSAVREAFQRTEYERAKALLFSGAAGFDANGSEVSDG
jgi:hypothetical protein